MNTPNDSRPLQPPAEAETDRAPELGVASGWPARPQRVQLSRRKGWRKPPYCRVVARPTKWGNPFAIGKCSIYGDVPDAETAVRCFEVWLKTTPAGGDMLSAARAELRGCHLACWCAPGSPCHADVLLSVANDGDVPTPGGAEANRKDH